MKHLQLLPFLQKATSPFHVVQESTSFLKQNGFEELHMGDMWELQTGGHYYTTIYGTTLFAFTIGKEIELSNNPIFHISDVDLIKGKRVAIVDDVVSTGASLLGLEALVEKAGGIIYKKAFVLAEGDAKDREDVIYLDTIPLL